MPRLPRIEVRGMAQHLVQRGIDRQPCFFCDDDRRRYLADLREIAQAETGTSMIHRNRDIHDLTQKHAIRSNG